MTNDEIRIILQCEYILNRMTGYELSEYVANFNSNQSLYDSIMKLVWCFISKDQDNFDVKFDISSDIMYLRFESTANSYGAVDASGIVVLRDMDTNKCTGVTILDVVHRINIRA